MPVVQLTRETLLQLAPGVRTRLDASGHVLVDAPDGTIVDAGPRGFVTLALFARPLALGEAIDRLERAERSSTDFVPTMNVINMLLDEGALVQPGAGAAPARGWADPVEHARMLHDGRRTGDYLAALAEAVRPGDVVLDLGTGSGVLAVAAARAGARRVYAVEASDIADVAERVFAVNGVRKQVTLLRGWSRHIELPEPADVLVSELIGNEPFEEEILETTLDARRRLLKAGARQVPHALTLLARPLLLPDAEARQRAIGHRAVERWQRLYGIDFEPLLDAATPGPVNMPTEAEVAARGPPWGRRSPWSPSTSPRSSAHRCTPRPISSSMRRAPSTRSPSRSAPPCTGRSPTRSIPGSGRRRVGRRRSGCFPTRCTSGLATDCGCATPAGSPERPTGSTASSSVPIRPFWAMRVR